MCSAQKKESHRYKYEKQRRRPPPPRLRWQRRDDDDENEYIFCVKGSQCQQTFILLLYELIYTCEISKWICLQDNKKAENRKCTSAPMKRRLL